MLALFRLSIREFACVVQLACPRGSQRFHSQLFEVREGQNLGDGLGLRLLLRGASVDWELHWQLGDAHETILCWDILEARQRVARVHDMVARAVREACRRPFLALDGLIRCQTMS